MRVQPTILAAALLGGMTNAACSATVVNGSFEDFTGTFGSDGGAAVTAGSNMLSGWSVISQVAILRTPNSYNLTPSAGTNFLDLTSYRGAGGGSGQGVQQPITSLIVGTTYKVSFDVGVNNSSCGIVGNACRGPVSVLAQVGAQSTQVTHNPPAAGNVWRTYNLDFIADAASMPLRITMVSTAGLYVGLDNVTIAVVPEPSNALLLFVGCTGIGLWSRVHRRSAS